MNQKIEDMILISSYISNEMKKLEQYQDDIYFLKKKMAINSINFNKIKQLEDICTSKIEELGIISQEYNLTHSFNKAKNLLRKNV